MPYYFEFESSKLNETIESDINGKLSLFQLMTAKGEFGIKVINQTINHNTKVNDVEVFYETVKGLFMRDFSVQGNTTYVQILCLLFDVQT